MELDSVVRLIASDLKPQEFNIGIFSMYAPFMKSESMKMRVALANAILDFEAEPKDLMSPEVVSDIKSLSYLISSGISNDPFNSENQALADALVFDFVNILNFEFNDVAKELQEMADIPELDIHIFNLIVNNIGKPEYIINAMRHLEISYRNGVSHSMFGILTDPSYLVSSSIVELMMYGPSRAIELIDYHLQNGKVSLPGVLSETFDKLIDVYEDIREKGINSSQLLASVNYDTSLRYLLEKALVLEKDFYLNVGNLQRFVDDLNYRVSKL